MREWGPFAIVIAAAILIWDWYLELREAELEDAQ
ncbi:hypothetical protein OPTIMUS_162 [Mycobacterium phage Optimus]|uniref:Uncharacterized protein n=1 Tax=Mycobacterium phage Optimus TaxID=2922218 RepID=G1DAV1_9CAUD|nr:hypothetical protein FDG54_gp162 [Mycobacterium phage Optimus]AEJ92218.1 hypothetical protein OPTIMUS_162 [Mycobacterium phage Optimus]